MKYFVCYTTRDIEVTSELLLLYSFELKRNGEAFIDMLHNDSVDKQRRVLSELDSSDILILIETENVYNSKWVSIELNRAEANNIPIRKIKVKELKKILQID
jgi:hypothetical protein